MRATRARQRSNHAPLPHASKQDDCSAARRKPLVKVAKDVVGDYFKIVRWAPLGL